MGRQKLGKIDLLAVKILWATNRCVDVNILGIGLSKEERMLMVIGEIIQELIQAHEKQKDVDLNRMKSRISSKYGLESSPRLTDIIAAVPTVCSPSVIVVNVRIKIAHPHVNCAGSKAFPPAQTAR